MTALVAPDVVRVTASSQIGEQIRLAADNGNGVVARSSAGTPRHGRGSPGADDVLLDLSAMGEVLLINSKERVAIIEPGVTFPQLARLLREQGLHMDHPMLPPPGRSVVASLLDRTPTMAPRNNWDFTDPLLCAEIWFGTGESFRTGSASGPGSTLEEQWKAGMFQKNPFGPAQTDLLKLVQGSNGSLGIASWVSIRLERSPEIARPLAVVSDDLAPIGRFVSEMTRRRIGTEMVILDQPQIAAMEAALGVEATGAPRARWTLLVRITSLPWKALRSIEYQLAELAEIAASSGVQIRDLAGTGTEEFLSVACSLEDRQDDWKRHATGESRELSFLTSLSRAEALVDIARRNWETVAGTDGVCTYLQPVNQGRSCHVEMTALVDSDGAHALDVGMGEMGEEMASSGAFFSRPIGPIVEVAYRRCPDVVETLIKMKQVLDPANVLSRGALCFH